MNKKGTYGGARKGAGRKKSDIKTVVISFKVPESIAPMLKAKIKLLIEKTVNKPQADARGLNDTLEQ